jgi:hypothetical protein
MLKAKATHLFHGGCDDQREQREMTSANPAKQWMEGLVGRGTVTNLYVIRGFTPL